MAKEAAAETKGKDGAADATPAKGGGRKKLLAVVGGIMVLEGVAIFGAIKFLGGAPQPTAAEPVKVEEVKPLVVHEIEVAKLRAPNVKDGRLILWSVEVAIRATKPAAGDHHGAHGDKPNNSAHGEPAAHGEAGGEAAEADSPKAEAEALAKVVHEQDRTIKDRLAGIIRAADAKHLQEDGLGTVRRQIKFELERILGDKIVIQDVLIPECTPYPTGF